MNLAVHPVTGEWMWTGRTDRDGYGRVGSEGAHRLVYTALGFEIPPGLVLDHVKARGCTSRACCSWWHLEPVLPVVNTMRGNSPHAVNARKDECDHGHPFDLLNTYWKPDGHRDCRTCIRARVKSYRKRKRARAGVIRFPAAGISRAA